MAWTSMHFAVGMACSGAAAGAVAAITRRGWRWIPALMTLGGFWAIVPDMPRLWREDFPWLPLAGTLGDINLEHRLHAIGDLFFFHHWLDAPPHLERQYALHGLILMILLYNVGIGLLMVLERRQQSSRELRMLQAHDRRITSQAANPPSTGFVATMSAKLPPHPPRVRSSHLTRLV